MLKNVEQRPDEDHVAREACPPGSFEGGDMAWDDGAGVDKGMRCLPLPSHLLPGVHQGRNARYSGVNMLLTAYCQKVRNVDGFTAVQRGILHPILLIHRVQVPCSHGSDSIKLLADCLK